jgi:hypothetical protein
MQGLSEEPMVKKGHGHLPAPQRDMQTRDFPGPVGYGAGIPNLPLNQGSVQMYLPCPLVLALSAILLPLTYPPYPRYSLLPLVLHHLLQGWETDEDGSVCPRAWGLLHIPTACWPRRPPWL